MDYKSRRWKHKRGRILKRDGYICQISKRYGRLVEATTVHHVFPVSKYPEYQWCDWNLIAVSAAAHNSLHVRDSDELTDEGRKLLERIALKNNIKLD